MTDGLYAFAPVVVPDAELRRWYAVAGAVNDKPFRGHPRRTVRILTVSGVRTTGEHWDVTGRLLIDEAGFDVPLRTTGNSQHVDLIPLYGTFDPSILDGVKLLEVD